MQILELSLDELLSGQLALQTCLYLVSSNWQYKPDQKRSGSQLTKSNQRTITSTGESNINIYKVL